MITKYLTTDLYQKIIKSEPLTDKEINCLCKLLSDFPAIVRARNARNERDALCYKLNSCEIWEIRPDVNVENIRLSFIPNAKELLH